MVYDMRTAMDVTRQIALDELKKEVKENGEQLDRLLGIDNLMEGCSRTIPFDEIAE